MSLAAAAAVPFMPTADNDQGGRITRYKTRLNFLYAHFIASCQLGRLYVV
jgi:hypothetical protein